MKTKIIGVLRRSRERLDKAEVCVTKWRKPCCQEGVSAWFEVCDVCIGNGKASERLGDIADIVILLYLDEKDRNDGSGSYSGFVENALERSNDGIKGAVSQAFPGARF